MARILTLALAGLALPAIAQTTTVTTQQQPASPPPPPPPSTTTVTTQSPQPSPSTQVVVNPQDPPPKTTTTVRTEEETGVSAPSGRSAVAIIATDALYGGIAGTLIGGGITLIDQGHNVARNLMVGAGIGILAGAGYGVYESATQPPPRHAVAEADPGASNVNGFALTATSGRF